MKVIISRDDSSIIIDGVQITLEKFEDAGVPASVRIVHMDTEGNSGLIEWVEKLPPMPITVSQFTPVFNHAVAMFENEHNNVLLRQRDAAQKAAEEQGRLLAEQVAAKLAETKQIQEINDRMKKLESREKL